MPFPLVKLERWNSERRGASRPEFVSPLAYIKSASPADSLAIVWSSRLLIVARALELRRFLLMGAFLCITSVALTAQDYASARQLYLSGQYAEAESFAAEQVERGIWNERWPRLLIECQLVQGKYDEALKAYEAAMKRFPTSLTLRLLGLDALRKNNMIEQADAANAQIMQLLQTSPTRFASRDNLVAAGRYFTELGEDARQILELFYDRVREADAEFLEAYIATAELALSKGDFKVAANTLSAAERFDSTDPRTAYMLARAWSSSDGEKADVALQRALALNESHVPSLIYVAENQIDAEQYEKAEETIKKVFEVNPKQQEGHALLAVIAHLRGKYEDEKKHRAEALKTWSKNPAVDHLIGRKLSAKYRFKEGAEYQNRALEMNPKFTPARFHLAQDYLRLGKEDEGWKLAEAVGKADEYNVVVHNLLTLYDRLQAFSNLEADGIFVRMDPREANVYGDQVLELLSQARQVLCKKYDVQPDGPIVVEIFPEQKDFAIRTFGLPGGDGFLGVCFGRVITANSPASQGARPSNWQSVLWHEFCHVVTLEKTRNRMPRWLSEGISVYEERTRDTSWGESMTPQYREMLLDDGLTKLSDLSAAFLSPPSPLHLQFAYFESSLAVEFLIEKHGLDALKNILTDLGDGIPINDAITRNAGSLDKLDAQFAEFARKVANEFAPDADWSRESLPEKPSADELQTWLEKNPDNYWAIRSLASIKVRQKEYTEAKELLEKIVQLEAVTGSQGGPLEQLAAVYGQLKQTEQEKETLTKIVSLSSDALPALTRLIEMSEASEDWESVLKYSQKVIAINPLIPAGHQSLSKSASQLDRDRIAVDSLRSMLSLDPYDPAELHFRLAQSHQKLDELNQARHHVLAALEEAPRYRAAHRLLLELAESETKRQQAEEKTREETQTQDNETDKSDEPKSPAEEPETAK